MATEAGMTDTVDRILKGVNPNIRSTLVTFSYRKEDRCFKPATTIDHTVTHMSVDGHVAHQSEQNNDLTANPNASHMLKNQFNFCDRASQTYNLMQRESGVQTEPPPIISFGATATQFGIYDAYIEDLKQQQIAASRAARQSAPPGAASNQVTNTAAPSAVAVDDDAVADPLQSPAMLRAVHIIERLVVQNLQSDVTLDYKYWEDEADRYKEDGGTLLPLWKFANERTRRRHVTCVAWHRQYLDLFAASFGSFDFLRQTGGAIHLYTLKNPSHPELAIPVDCGVMSIEWHPTVATLLAAGLYDGSVCVYDVSKKAVPLLRPTVHTGQHLDVCWSVRWLGAHNPSSLFSASSDGRVTIWTIGRDELLHNDVVTLEHIPTIAADEATAAQAAPVDASIGGVAGATCIAVHPTDPSIFVVGTEDGDIRMCSLAYHTQSLQRFAEHTMSVYALAWNTYHDDIFLSASADWSVRMWHTASPAALMVFDLAAPVGDVAWAPYSSAVFAGVTSDGKVHVYDLHDNKHEPICDQSVVHKARLTRLAFNPVEPIIIVGDDRGGVLSLKLSPNLRKQSRDPEQERAKIGAIVEVRLLCPHLPPPSFVCVCTTSLFLLLPRYLVDLRPVTTTGNPEGSRAYGRRRRVLISRVLARVGLVAAL